MKQHQILAHMASAVNYSKNTHCDKFKVGSILVKEYATYDTIISIGWNGTPSGWDNKCEFENADGTLSSHDHALHAESNAIAKLARSPMSSTDSIMFSTHASCPDCAKLIIQSGIKRFYYIIDYKNTIGLGYLEKSNIEVVKIDKDEYSKFITNRLECK